MKIMPLPLADESGHSAVTTGLQDAYVTSSSLPSSQSGVQSHLNESPIHLIPPELHVKNPVGQFCKNVKCVFLIINSKIC